MYIVSELVYVGVMKPTKSYEMSFFTFKIINKNRSIPSLISTENYYTS